MRLAKDLYITEAEYGFVILDSVQGTYWNLNATGTSALHTLLHGGTEHDAAQTLVERYQVDQDTAAADVSALVTELTREQILHPAAEKPLTGGEKR